MPPHPSTSEGSALRKPRAKQGNRFLAHPLPSTARRRTPARCRTRRLACAPAMKSPARYRAGRAKQNMLPKTQTPSPTEESGEGSPRAGGGLCPLPCPARKLCIAGKSTPGKGRRQQQPLALGSARCLVRLIFLCCSFYHAPGHFPCLLSSPWPELPAGARLLASFWQKKEEETSLYAP